MLHRGDAVGKHTIALREHLLTSGFESDIFVELEDPETASLTRPLEGYAASARPRDVLVYQLATASDMAGWLERRPENLVVNYHNVTPAALFAPWDNQLARHQVRATHEVAALAHRATLGVAVSEFNRADLQAAGFAVTAVVPPIVDLSRAPAGPERDRDPGADPIDGAAPGARGRRQRGTRWLAVGRIAPNKALQDVIGGLLAYRRSFDSHAELVVVGGAAVPAYASALRRFAADLGLASAVHFVGKLDEPELGCAYRDADVLVVASEHEGFCLPVVEAMAADLPPVAYREGALAEVMGDAGVLLQRKDPIAIASAVHRLLSDEAWHAQVIAAGRARVPQLGLDDAGARLAGLLAAAYNRRPWPRDVAISH